MDLASFGVDEGWRSLNRGSRKSFLKCDKFNPETLKIRMSGSREAVGEVTGRKKAPRRPKECKSLQEHLRT